MKFFKKKSVAWVKKGTLSPWNIKESVNVKSGKNMTKEGNEMKNDNLKKNRMKTELIKGSNLAGPKQRCLQRSLNQHRQDWDLVP